MNSEDRAQEAFNLLSRKYVQRADARQSAMGLQYMTAETHDLAKFVANFARTHPPEIAQLIEAAKRVVAELDTGDGNAPGHAHDFPGVWDDDSSNGSKRGLQCQWCADWASFRTAFAAIKGSNQ